MIIGYARISTESQHIDRQIMTLKKAGAEKIFTDKITFLHIYIPNIIKKRYNKEELTAEQRRTSMNEMIKLGLESAIKL